MVALSRRLVVLAIVGALAAAMGRVTLSFVRDEYQHLSEMIAWLGIDEYTHQTASAAQCGAHACRVHSQ